MPTAMPYIAWGRFRPERKVEGLERCSIVTYRAAQVGGAKAARRTGCRERAGPTLALVSHSLSRKGRAYSTSMGPFFLR